MGDEARALVRNAADPEQVKRGGRKEKDARDRELHDLRAVLATEPGRRVLWRVLWHCGVFASVYDEGPLIYKNAGRQDVGHFLMAEIEAADDEAIFRLMVEARRREKRTDTENEASRIVATEDAHG